MKKKLIIVRHGLTLANKFKVWNGVYADLPLLQEGKEEAWKVGQALRKFDIEVIYCSPLLRAQETAKHIVEAYSKPISVITKNELRECDFGIAEGQKMEDVRKKYSLLIDKMYWGTKNTWELSFPGGESKHETFKRVNACINSLWDSFFDCALIVSHGGVMNALDIGWELHGLNYEHGTFNVIEYDTDTRKFIRIV